LIIRIHHHKVIIDNDVIGPMAKIKENSISELRAAMNVE
jgi:hypothetical protein